MARMLVEFFGPPGAGKSTLTPLVAGGLRRRGHHVHRVHMTGYEALDGAPLSARRLHVDRVVALTTQPTLSREVLGGLHREGRGRATSWLVNLARRSHGAARAARREGITLLEEGPLSAVCIAKSTMREPWSPQRALRVIPLPDVTVLLVLDPAEANRRVLQRAARYADRSPGELYQAAERYLEVAEEVEQAIAERTTIVRIDTGTAPPEVLAGRICDALVGRLTSASSR